MDQTKVAVVLISGFFGLLIVLLGYLFITSHWEDIKTLFIVALVLGGSFSLAVGGLKLKSRK